MSNLQQQLRGYRLTTAEILYRLPDHPVMLQSFIWQDLDLAPQFPILKKFLRFWQSSLDGKLHSVRVASCGLISRAELDVVGLELTLH
jgi:uncharacterized protein Usg